jgi:hypothetical protein
LRANFPAGVEPECQAALRVGIHIRAQPSRHRFTKCARADTLTFCRGYDSGVALMNPIVRAMRAKLPRRDNWAQIRIAACALLLPPVTLGAAFYSMLAAPEEGAARPPGTAAKTQVVRPELLRDTTPTQGVGPDPQPAAPPNQTIANPEQPVPERGVSASWPAPAEASTGLLPRALLPPAKALPQVARPQVAPLTAQTPAAHAPSAAAPPSADGSAASPPSARKHARSETAAARRSAQRNEHAFSLRDWLQQIGIVPRNTRG